MKNEKHRLFISEMIKHCDKHAAYLAAYPEAKGESLRTAANKLCRKYKTEIDTARHKIYLQVMAETEAQAKEQMQQAYADMHIKRVALARIIKDEHKITRHIKLEDRVEEVKDSISVNAIIRAIEVDTKLENDWYNRPAKAGKKEKELIAQYDGYDIYIEGYTPADSDEGIKEAWHRANPDKCTFIPDPHTGSKSKLGHMEYSIIPPWIEDPGWLSKQREEISNVKSETPKEEDPFNPGPAQHKFPLRDLKVQNYPDPSSDHHSHPSNHPGHSTAPAAQQLTPQSSSLTPVVKPEPNGAIPQGYDTIYKIVQLCHRRYYQYPTATNYQRYKSIEALSVNRNTHPQLLKEYEQKAGWQCHPNNRNWVRRI
jgi:hypothetical protein